MNFISFQEGLLYDRFCLNGAKKPYPNFWYNFFMTNVHGLFESLILINTLFPPHGFQTAYSAPKGCGHSWNLFFIDFTDSIIVCVHINDKIFVNFLLNVIYYLIIDHWLEGKPGLLLFENLIRDIWYDLFTKVQINKPCGW